MNNLGANDGTCAEFEDGTSCVVSGQGYVDIDVVGPTACSSNSGTNCPSPTTCTGNNTISSTVKVCYIATSPGTYSPRDVLVCRQWRECSTGTVSGCADCNIIQLTPTYSGTGDCKTFTGGSLPPRLVCPSAAPPPYLAAGTYQMKAWAADVDGRSCNCSNACVNGCSTNCGGDGHPSGVGSCCIVIP